MHGAHLQMLMQPVMHCMLVLVQFHDRHLMVVMTAVSMLMLMMMVFWLLAHDLLLIQGIWPRETLQGARTTPG